MILEIFLGLVNIFSIIYDLDNILSKYTPGNIDATEFLEAALARMPWEKIFEDVEGRFYQQRLI